MTTSSRQPTKFDTYAVPIDACIQTKHVYCIHLKGRGEVGNAWLQNALNEQRVAHFTDSELRQIASPYFRSVVEHHLMKAYSCAVRQNTSTHAPIMLFDILDTRSFRWILSFFINARIHQIVCVVRHSRNLPPAMRNNLDMCVFHSPLTNAEHALVYENLHQRCATLSSILPARHSSFLSPETDEWNSLSGEIIVSPEDAHETDMK